MSLFKFGFTSTASKEGTKKVKKDSGKSLPGNLTFLEEKTGNPSLNLGT